MIDTPEPWDLPRLDAFIEAVLQRMADNRDVMSDESGKPYYAVHAAGVERSGMLRIDLEADCSAIGMPTNTPITVKMDPINGPIQWSLEQTLIATTDRRLTSEDVGDQIGMEELLTAFRKWATQDRTR